MAEVLIVPKYNEYLRMKKLEEQRKNKRGL